MSTALAMNIMKYFLSVFSIILLSFFSLGMTGSVDTQQGIVIVPNVEGITVEMASTILWNAGLSPLLSTTAETSALVIRQDPRPGFSLKAGGDVLISTEVTRENDQQPQAQITSTDGSRGIPSGQRNPMTTTGGVTVSGGTQYMVTPTQSTGQTQSAGQTGHVQSLPEWGQSTIFYQPAQPPVSPYFVQQTTPRFYPAWYPRQFLPEGASPSGIQGTPGSAPVQSQTPYQTTTVTPREPDAPLVFYPKVGFDQDEGSMSIFGGQPGGTKPVGVFATSTRPAVLVPYVLYLSQADALAALTKAGLLVGDIAQVESLQFRPGAVMKQFPEARKLVPAGTRVQLWFAK